jgi:MoxR-like ATPase
MEVLRLAMSQDLDFRKNLVKQDLEGVYGQEEALNQLRSAILMDRHVILVGPPGIGKTTIVKSLVDAMPGDDDARPYIRVQGSPDLTAEDLIGDIDPVKALEHGPMSPEAFTPGKMFRADGGVLFFDEVNRCSEKLQNALLQALEEREATIGSYDVELDANFLFIGTMNPEESATQPLSDVFLDRFDLIYMDAPEKIETEIEIVNAKGQKLTGFPNPLLLGTVSFIRGLRSSEDLEKHPGVRATIGVYERSQSNAYLDGREEVEPQDIEDALISVLAHRIRLKPSLQYVQEPEEFLRAEFSQHLENMAGEKAEGP